jgi:sirohydrochlorin cobaltochelatase
MATNSNSNSKIGVLLVGHGSRLPYSKEVISQLQGSTVKNQNILWK